MTNKKIHNLSALRKIIFLSLVGAAISVFEVPANALDLTSDASRVLSDLAYLPLDNQFVCTTDFSYSNSTGDIFGNLGAPRSTFTRSTNTLTQTFSDGINDDLTLRLTAAYGINSTTTNPTTGSSTTSNAYGLDDPVLGLVWRVLDQRINVVNLDLIATYAPDLVEAVAASATQVGSVARGGQATTIETALSYKTRDFTVYLDGSATYLSKRNVSDNINTITSYNSNWQYSLSLNTQTRFNDEFAINAGISETFKNDVYGLNTTTLVGFDNNAGNITSVNAALIFNISPNKLVISLTYNHQIYTDSSTVYPTTPSLSTTTKSNNADVLGARLQYMFD